MTIQEIKKQGAIDNLAKHLRDSLQEISYHTGCAQRELFLHFEDEMVAIKKELKTAQSLYSAFIKEKQSE